MNGGMPISGSSILNGDNGIDGVRPKRGLLPASGADGRLPWPGGLFRLDRAIAAREIPGHEPRSHDGLQREEQQGEPLVPGDGFALLDEELVAHGAGREHEGRHEVPAEVQPGGGVKGSRLRVGVGEHPAAGARDQEDVGHQDEARAEDLVAEPVVDAEGDRAEEAGPDRAQEADQQKEQGAAKDELFEEDRLEHPEGRAEQLAEAVVGVQLVADLLEVRLAEEVDHRDRRHEQHADDKLAQSTAGGRESQDGERLAEDSMEQDPRDEKDDKKADHQWIAGGSVDPVSRPAWRSSRAWCRA